MLMGESSHVPVKALECETQKDLILGLGRFLHGLEVSLALHSGPYIKHFITHNYSEENDLIEVSKQIWINILRGYLDFIVYDQP